MPQLAVNLPAGKAGMKVNTQNKVYRYVKNNRFKMRHAPYSNRYAQAGDPKTEMTNLLQKIKKEK